MRASRRFRRLRASSNCAATESILGVAAATAVEVYVPERGGSREAEVVPAQGDGGVRHRQARLRGGPGGLGHRPHRTDVVADPGEPAQQTDARVTGGGHGRAGGPVRRLEDGTEAAGSPVPPQFPPSMRSLRAPRCPRASGARRVTASAARSRTATRMPGGCPARWRAAASGGTDGGPVPDAAAPRTAGGEEVEPGSRRTLPAVRGSQGRRDHQPTHRQPARRDPGSGLTLGLSGRTLPGSLPGVSAEAGL